MGAHTSVIIPAELRRSLETSAAKNCRSLSAEIVFRLKVSLREDAEAQLESFRTLLAGGP